MQVVKRVAVEVEENVEEHGLEDRDGETEEKDEQQQESIEEEKVSECTCIYCTLYVYVRMSCAIGLPW